MRTNICLLTGWAILVSAIYFAVEASDFPAQKHSPGGTHAPLEDSGFSQALADSLFPWLYPAVKLY